MENASANRLRARFPLHPGGIVETGLAKYMTREQIRAAGGYDGNDNPIVDPSKGLKSVEQGDSTIENARTFSRSPSEGTGHDAGVVDQQM